MIDFTNCKIKNKSYNGANGKKICIEYENSDYMLKFPTISKLNKEMHYTNGCISEYLGCHIFNALNITAQETILGTYNVDGIDKLVVACKDFSSVGIIPQDFASLKNRIIDSEHNGYGKELSDILYTINEQTVLEQDILLDYFWDVFVTDAFIGNWDRHNGNWGFLYNQIDDTVKISPIYDCGSSLYPQADDKLMNTVLTNKNEFLARIYNRPTSSIEIEGKRINYYDYLISLVNEDCCRAIIRFEDKVDMDKIQKIIIDTPTLNDLQQEFYSKMLISRKELIIDKAYELIKKQKPDLVNNSNNKREHDNSLKQQTDDDPDSDDFFNR